MKIKECELKWIKRIQQNILNFQHSNSKRNQILMCSILCITIIIMICAIELFNSKDSFMTKNISISNVKQQQTNKKVQSQRLFVLTFATHSATFLCDLLSSAILFGHHIRVLEYGNRGGNGNVNNTNVLYRKLTSVLDELQNNQLNAYNNENDLILFLDGFDTLLLAHPQQIINSFNQIIRQKSINSSSILIFTAEKGCWPFLDGRANGEHFCNEIYPQSATPYRYLNSGSWIATISGAIQSLRLMIERGQHALNANKPPPIDQELATLVMIDLIKNPINQINYARQIDQINHNPLYILLDYHCVLFQSVHMSIEDVEVVSMSNQRRHEVMAHYVKHRKNSTELKVTNEIRNRITDSRPAVLHFNGGSKHYQRIIERQLNDELWFERPFDIIQEFHDFKHNIIGLDYVETCVVRQ